MEEIRETSCPEETFAFGKWLGERAKPGEIFCLDGELGTGKTVLTQGFAAGLGITEPVNSPTFTIVQVYEEGRLPLYHFDVYRIGDPSEMDEVGYEDCFFGEGVCLVEWASLIEELIPEEALWIRLEKEFGRGDDYRRITVRQV
ncbi:MAG: tRNA (adenosine(37)-N6)-threonylcarbamoyltransferase complex ATPase subunit type 1 TsaE [Lachnospiraceae bacterium]|nr:tRNA (adenosine(37)-N6)-threonylcarbamoyltransferase complex ATPase subunit type 1 TsaE [Lachnospiraceae bacterium]MCI9487581.1 tRNA (adenosine(37)-N6)-threonylcarbamoyltransferase complex ATPase subunit type 1 TsaE [Lachnospiraceae bacterium]